MVSLSLSRPYSKEQSKKKDKKENKLSSWELERIAYEEKHFLEFGDKWYAMGTVTRKGLGRMVKGANYYVIMSGKNDKDYRVISRHDNKEIALWNFTNATKETMLNDLIAALKPKKQSKRDVMDLAVKPIKSVPAIAELAAMHLIDKNPALQEGMDKGTFNDLLKVEKARFIKRLERKEFKVLIIPDTFPEFSFY